MSFYLRNDAWKEDKNLEEDMKMYIGQSLKRKEILSFLVRDYSCYTWSIRSLDRRLRHFGIYYQDSNITVDDVKKVVSEELEGPGKLLGYRAMQKKVRQVHGVHVPRALVHAVMYDLDPQGLQTRALGAKKRKPKGHFSSKGANFVHSVDGHDKLMGYQNSTYPLAIYGCIDTASRKLLWLRIWVSNSDPQIIGRWYLEYLYEKRMISSYMRMDKGTETGTMATMHAYLRHQHDDMDDATDTVIYGPSTSNQIERWWKELHERLEKYFKVHLSWLKDNRHYNPADENDRMIMAYLMIPLMQKELDIFKDTIWNCHRIRAQKDTVLPCGVPDHIYSFPEEYGLEECGLPVTEEQLKEVATLSGVLNIKKDFLEAEFRRKCEQILPNIEDIEAKDCREAYMYLKESRIMPLTSAERQRKRQERLQVMGQYKDYRKNQNEMSKKCRRIKAMKEKTLPKSIYDMLVTDRKEKIYKRVAKFRAKNLSQTSANVIEPFKTASAMGKAMARAKRALQNALPLSPKRKAAVMKKLYTTIPDITLSTSEQLQEHKNGISADIVANVKNFYKRDDISRQAPGRRNVINVRGADGIKIQFQTRHLTSSILETHALFCEEFPDTRIGKSKFAELRPRHVLLSSKLPHNVCLCRHHENFIIAINALHKANLSVPLYSHDLPQLFLCSLPTYNCNACNNGKGFLKAYPIEETTEVLWSVWKNAEDGRLSKIVEEGTTRDLVGYITSIIPKFMKHCYVKRMQAMSYNTERQQAAAASGQGEHSLIQIDFSENYTCISQDEIQILVSDNITHSKDTVIPYIDRLLEELPKIVRKVSLWSDGPASQFKNRYILASLKPLQDKYNITIRWNFLATSHGKGPVDGIGGSVKRFVWNRKFVVFLVNICHWSNAEGFKLAARTSQVKVVAVTPNELNERYQKLNLDKIFRDAILVKGIANMHFKAVNQDQPVYFHLTKDALAVNDKASPIVSIRKGKEHGTDVRVGDWCAVEYERFSYPGEVKQIEGSDYKVSVMIPAGKNWKWSTCPDEIFYLKEKILILLQPPCIVNNRGHFSFKDFKSSI
ncbi:hypothetical protein GQR58_010849 [Nymphon striatum]|nr:hypothetical protein GQR58_010849 [Nymphon striatum]